MSEGVLMNGTGQNGSDRKLFEEFTQELIADAGGLLGALKVVEGACSTKQTPQMTQAVSYAETMWTNFKLDKARGDLAERLGSHIHRTEQCPSSDHLDIVHLARQLDYDLAALKATWPHTTPSTGDPDVAVLQSQTAAAKESVSRVIKHAGQMSVPDLVAGHLDEMRTGWALDFHEHFAEEFPDPDQRQLLLNELAMHPKSIPTGVIDLKAGLIYKKVPGKLGKLTVIAPLAWAVLGGLIILFIAGVATKLKLDEWNLTNGHRMLAAYIVALAGAVIHIMFETVKQQQNGHVQILAIGRGLDWLNIRWLGLALSFLAIVVTVVGLRVLNVDDLAVYLFAGYSADSVAGILLTRFDSVATLRLSDLKGKISGTSTPTTS
jgi:hypothetical protein